MEIVIASAALATIRRHAASAPREEICGLLLGVDGRVEEARPVRNVAADPVGSFEVDPAALFAALRAERAGGATLLGHYHSHPAGPARPSARDAAAAAGDGRLWLIVAGDTVAGWVSRPTGFVPVTLREVPVTRDEAPAGPAA